MANEHGDASSGKVRHRKCVHLRDPEECADCARLRSIRFYKAVMWISALCGVALTVTLIATW